MAIPLPVESAACALAAIPVGAVFVMSDQHARPMPLCVRLAAPENQPDAFAYTALEGDAAFSFQFHRMIEDPGAAIVLSRRPLHVELPAPLSSNGMLIERPGALVIGPRGMMLTLSARDAGGFNRVGYAYLDDRAPVLHLGNHHPVTVFGAWSLVESFDNAPPTVWLEHRVPENTRVG